MSACRARGFSPAQPRPRRRQFSPPATLARVSTDPGPEPPAASARPPVLTRAQASLPGARRAVVIGAGSFGTAIAVLLARAGMRATLQTRTEAQAATLSETRTNETYLPGVELPSQLRVEPVAHGVARADYVFLAVPSTTIAAAIVALQTAGLPPRTPVVSLSKGLVEPDGYAPTAVLRAHFGAVRVACLGGPSHAQE